MHISNINNDVQTDILVNKVPQLNIGHCPIKLSVLDYFIIERIDDTFYKVVSFGASIF